VFLLPFTFELNGLYIPVLASTTGNTNVQGKSIKLSMGGGPPMVLLGAVKIQSVMKG
jgi:hypothetical protein